ncbi:hypothetical protein [Haladaptatus caseinilyticus]|uniref:hypothetical protein n=1 Tax=Haladaptatus caseinilyticus TaxID=2993314 RepID=UPI00224AD04A|nr:hypothetical protein [Haladaptatus caseinilyticus]
MSHNATLHNASISCALACAFASVPLGAKRARVFEGTQPAPRGDPPGASVQHTSRFRVRRPARDATERALGAGVETRCPERPQAARPDWSVASDAEVS